MAVFKCPDCGASLTDDSRFCKYCGAKLEENVQKIEVSGTVNKNVTHRFSFHNESSVKREEIRAEKEAQRLEALAKLEEEKRKREEAEHRHTMQILKICGAVAGIGILLLFVSSWFSK